ncbi:MAG: Thiol peroxidase, Bcp-type (EC [uncultured Paraburkholderia sp.]|nr:MAG: Thiol peroxidase, Bcp-type (EC [uncultured Paraburkholderia sp.]
MPIAVDQPIPDFTAPATGGEITLSRLHGKKVVLYFYPKDTRRAARPKVCSSAICIRSSGRPARK